MSADAWLRLAAVIARHYLLAAEGGGDGAALLGAAARLLDGAAAPALARRPAAHKPVRRYFAEASRLAATSPLRAVAAAFAAVEAEAEWLQNPNYTAANSGEAFLESYGYVEIAGPGRTIEAPALRIGLLLLGPHRHYRDHSHPAEEIYHVVAGAASWWREGAAWREERAGAAIHHAPNVRHATRTGAEPMLALYCWSGAIGAPARLSDAGG
jgi:quercetin dioxygenase-like cupin family protein